MAGLGPWFRESMRLVASRAGHLLPFVLFLVLVPGLLSSVALWFGVRDTIITFESGESLPAVDYGGALAALVAAVVLVPISMVAAVVAKAAVAHQTWAAHGERPVDWSVSLAAVGRRWPTLLGAASIRTAIYTMLSFGFLALVLLQPAVILLFPVALGLSLLVLARLGFVAQATVLAPAGTKPLSTSYRTSGRRPWWVLYRLLMLGLVALQFLLVARLIGNLVTDIVDGAEPVVIEAGSRVIETNDLLGSDLALFLLGSTFGALGLGVNHAVAAAGTMLLYRHLGGPTQALPPAELSASAIEAGWEPR